MMPPAPAISGYSGLARADEHMVLVDKIDVQSTKGIATFDISFVDPRFNRDVLAHRTNALVDFFNTPLYRLGLRQSAGVNHAINQ